MEEGSDTALLASLLGDPARVTILAVLMGGQAFTARELASEAGITIQTARSHLAELEQGGLLRRRKQGQHRYFALANDDVGVLLQTMTELATRSGHVRTRTGPTDPAMCRARVCYNHLAGEMGVRLLDSMIARQFIEEDGENLALTGEGQRFVATLDIDIAGLSSARRPLCKACLDWSGRRSHLAGALGTALLDRFYQLKWATRGKGTRVVRFTRTGEKQFMRLFPVA